MVWIVPAALVAAALFLRLYRLHELAPGTAPMKVRLEGWLFKCCGREGTPSNLATGQQFLGVEHIFYSDSY